MRKLLILVGLCSGIAFCSTGGGAELTAKLLSSSSADECAGTPCSHGCCPYKDWYCCSDDFNCAYSASACPGSSKVQRFDVTKANCDADETECAAGCCPEPNWVCCADNFTCADKFENCIVIPPPSLKRGTLTKLIDAPAEDCAGPMCGEDIATWCCPYEGFECCSDTDYCGKAGACP